MTAPMMTSQMVADRLGVTRATVHSYTSRGTLPPADAYVGRTPVWDSGTIEAWIASRPGMGNRTPRKRP